MRTVIAIDDAVAVLKLALEMAQVNDPRQEAIVARKGRADDARDRRRRPSQTSSWPRSHRHRRDEDFLTVVGNILILVIKRSKRRARYAAAAIFLTMQLEGPDMTRRKFEDELDPELARAFEAERLSRLNNYGDREAEWAAQTLVVMNLEKALSAALEAGIEITVLADGRALKLTDAEYVDHDDDDEEKGPPALLLAATLLEDDVPMTETPKTTKQKDRIGKKGFTVHVDEKAHQAFKALAAEKGTTVQALTELAMDMVFEKFGKPPMAQSEKTKKKLANVA